MISIFSYDNFYSFVKFKVSLLKFYQFLVTVFLVWLLTIFPHVFICFSVTVLVFSHNSNFLITFSFSRQFSVILSVFLFLLLQFFFTKFQVILLR